MGRREQEWLSPEGFAPLLPPASDALVEEFGIARVALPGFGKFGAVAARAAILRQVVEADAHRQWNAFSERDRLLRPHGRQGLQHASRGIRPSCTCGGLVRLSDGRQAPPQTRKGLAAPPPQIRQFMPIRPRTTCRAPAYAPWSIAKARNGVPRPRNRAGGAAALAQQSGLLPHDRKDRPRLPPVALYNTFELGALIRRHAQTIDDEVFDPVHVVVPGQAPIDSDRPGC